MTIRLTFLAWLAAALLATAACGDNDGKSDDPRILFDASGNGRVRSPWPDDRLHAADGSIFVPAWWFARMPATGETAQARRIIGERSAEISDLLDGFGCYGSIVVPLSATPDTSTIEAAIGIFDEAGESHPRRFEYIEDERIIELLPDRAFKPDATYTVVITNALRTGYGPTFGGPGAFGDVSAEAAASLAGVGERDILAAWKFTTGNPAAGLTALRRELVDAGAAALSYEVISVLPPDESDVVDGGSNIDSVIDIRLYSPDVAEGAAAGAVVEVPLTITLPKREAGSEPPTVVLGQHGLLGSRRRMLKQSDGQAARGYAMLSIDAAEHGDRETTTALTEFFDLSDIAHLRNNMRQTIIDLTGAVGLIYEMADGDLNGDGMPDLSTGPVEYLGVSMGGLLGAVMVGLEDRIADFVLQVPGAGLTDIMGESMLFQVFAPVWWSHDTGLAPKSKLFARYLNVYRPLFQLGLEPVEPFNFVQLYRARAPEERSNVLVQMAVGDGIMPNGASYRLGDAFGLEQRWNLAQEDDGGVSGAWVWDPGEYDLPYGLMAHAAISSIDNAKEQQFEFIRSRGRHILGPPFAP